MADLRALTDLAVWLCANDVYAKQLADELGVDKQTIYFLTFPRGRGHKYTMLRFELLRKVARRTGIRPGVLIEDAMQWEDDDGAGEERNGRAGNGRAAAGVVE